MKKIKVLIFLLLSFSLSVFARDADNSVNKAPEKKDCVPYRGMRNQPKPQKFMIKSLEAQKNYNGENSLMEITVIFSMPVDPRTVNSETVLINGKPCNYSVFFHFGRKGESVRITIVNAEDSYTVTFDGIQSYKADKLNKIEFENIQHGTEIVNKVN